VIFDATNRGSRRQQFNRAGQNRVWTKADSVTHFDIQNEKTQLSGGHTRKVKVERVACPWQIRRFTNADAEFVSFPHDRHGACLMALSSTCIVFTTPRFRIEHHDDAILVKYN